MKLFVSSGLLALAVMVAQPAAAVTIFSDDFNRADSTTVGNGWVETGGNAGDTAIAGNTLQLSENPSFPQVTHDSLPNTTIGLTNIVLDYNWWGVNSEVDDLLNVYWSADGTTFNLLTQHALNLTTSQSASDPLGVAAEGLSDIWIRFELAANQGNDTAHVDNVVLRGDSVPSQATPLPGTLVLFGAGLGVFGLFGMRAKRVRKA